ncbi:hypothetical protein CEP52_003504 [Fusarium oligoseptatum]|uniref:Uncharacterized protein n=1 Tax=Fusarium oligoseptatum TaxID=2604345 RepID=A0A428U8J6_9HYPO|nr:hypothetical protein CEP52_003504 [Fusarium oligoseptatum]
MPQPASGSAPGLLQLQVCSSSSTSTCTCTCISHSRGLKQSNSIQATGNPSRGSHDRASPSPRGPGDSRPGRRLGQVEHSLIQLGIGSQPKPRTPIHLAVVRDPFYCNFEAAVGSGQDSMLMSTPHSLDSSTHGYQYRGSSGETP